MELFSYAVLSAAGIFLLGGLWPVRLLLTALPEGQQRSAWLGLAVLLGLLVAGLLAYGVGLYAKLWTVDIVTAPFILLASVFVFRSSQVGAAAIGSIRGLARLQEEAVTDSVTALYNRRHLDIVLPLEMERCRQEVSPLGLMMIEVDHFKRINERFGRRAGDRVLRGLGGVVRAVLRPQDIIARVGGVGIAVIMPEASLSEARLQAERVRIRIAATEFEPVPDVDLGAERIRLTVSIGVTEFSAADAGRPACMLRRADEALQQAQQAGRNRVETLSVPTEITTTPSRVTHIQAWVAARNPEQAA